MRDDFIPNRREYNDGAKLYKGQSYPFCDAMVKKKGQSDALQSKMLCSKFIVRSFKSRSNLNVSQFWVMDPESMLLL